MKLRVLFAINLVFAIFFGVSCTLFPAWVFGLYGLEANSPAIWSARLVGGAILGYATLMWFGSRSATAGARHAIAVALLVQDLVGCLASLELQLTGSVNAFGWLSLALYGALALAYAFSLFVRPDDRPAPGPA